MPAWSLTCSGIVRRCGELRLRESRLKYIREGRKLLRNRARGYGGPKPGEDVFRGFRKGGE